MNHKVIKNASWIIACKIAQAVLALIISMLTARYLGPSNFGLINYAASLVAFSAPLMQLGLNNILVQETIQSPEEEGAIFGTAMMMSICSAVACMVGVVSFAGIVNAGHTQLILVCALYSLVLVFQALELIQYWFQAKYLSKYFAVVSLCVYVVISAYKIWLLATGKSVFWFAVSNALDVMLIDGALLIIYRRLGGKPLRFQRDVAKRMFSRSKYYIVSGMMVTVFAQTDRIMLTLMIDEAATGYYSAAVSCAGITSFVFSALIDSMRPAILESQNLGTEAFEHRTRQLYAMVVYLALTQSIVVSIFADLLIFLLYGAEYSAAVVPLRIIVWYTTFSYYGGAKDVWILAEHKQKYLVWLNFAGALTNVVLNLLLIPFMGVAGAALASLITQFFTNIVMGFVIKPLRRNNMLLLQALNPAYLKDILSDMANVVFQRNRFRNGDEYGEE